MGCHHKSEKEEDNTSNTKTSSYYYRLEANINMTTAIPPTRVQTILLKACEEKD